MNHRISFRCFPCTSPSWRAWRDRLIAMTAGAIAIPALLTPAIAAEPPMPDSFAEWCAQREAWGLDTQNTIETLLVEIGTEDCQEAETRLQSITDLHLNATMTMAETFSCLLIPTLSIIDLRPVVVAMPNLQMLDLSNAIVLDLAPLQQFSHLEDLNLSQTGLSNLTPLTSLSTLVRLDISANQVQDLSPLAGLDRLQQLNISHNAIRDLTVLAALPSLTSVDLTNNPIDASTCTGLWVEACDSHTYLER